MTDNELNALVAKRVMDAYNVREFSGEWTQVDPGLYQLPDYANDIAAAWQVVEKLPYYVEISKTSDGRYFCKVNPMEATAQADTAPRAICLAALDAVGVRVAVRPGVSMTWDISAEDHDELRSMFGVEVEG